MSIGEGVRRRNGGFTILAHLVSFVCVCCWQVDTIRSSMWYM